MLPCRLKDHVECPCEDCINQDSTGEAVEPVGTKCTDTHTHMELTYSVVGTVLGPGSMTKSNNISESVLQCII